MRLFLQSFVFAVSAWAFFNILLNYGYILEFVAKVFGVSGSYGVGAEVLLVSALAAGTGLFIGATIFAAFLSKFTARSSLFVLTLTTVAIFCLLQALTSIPIFRAPGTFATEFYTALEFIVSILTVMISTPFVARCLRVRTATQLFATNILALAAAISLTYVAVSLATESYALDDSIFARVLYFSGYGILPLTLICTVVSQQLKSERWAASAFIIAAFPLCAFYALGFLI